MVQITWLEETRRMPVFWSTHSSKWNQCGCHFLYAPSGWGWRGLRNTLTSCEKLHIGIDRTACRAGVPEQEGAACLLGRSLAEMLSIPGVVGTTAGAPLRMPDPRNLWIRLPCKADVVGKESEMEEAGPNPITKVLTGEAGHRIQRRFDNGGSGQLTAGRNHQLRDTCAAPRVEAVAARSLQVHPRRHPAHKLESSKTADLQSCKPRYLHLLSLQNSFMEMIIHILHEHPWTHMVKRFFFF